MLVADVMDVSPVEVSPDASFRQAAELFAEHQASDLAVVDANGSFMGVISEGDLLRALMPEFERTTRTIENLSIAEASRLFVESAPFSADRPIASLVIRKPITLKPDESMLVAATVMVSKNIRRLPVVQDGRLVGMLARAKIPWALLREAEATPSPGT